MTVLDRTFEIVIEKLVYGGSGIGRRQGMVVFVPFTAPGDRVRVRTLREKKNYIRGEISEILEPGPGRVAPRCPHFGKCGGCHWQHLEYPYQVKVKRELLREAFHHKFPETDCIPVEMTSSPQPFSYRSRARIQFRQSGTARIAGFYRPGSHSLEAIESCPLFRPQLNRALNFLTGSGTDTEIGTKVQEIDIACSFEEDRWAVASTQSVIRKRKAHYGERSPQTGDAVFLEKNIGRFRYSVSASAFFQANDFLIETLVGFVLEMAQNTGRGPALDIFAGAGLFSLPLSEIFESVVAIENSPEASRLCAENASKAGISRIQTVYADAAQWLETDKSGMPDQYDLVLLDPPRTGAGRQVMEQIRVLQPRSIIYVSCDPQTLLRDLSYIPSGEYEIKRIEGLDMFPQTYHFETVVQLIRS